MTAAVLFRTIIHLHFVQLFYRILYPVKSLLTRIFHPLKSHTVNSNSVSWIGLRTTASFIRHPLWVDYRNDSCQPGGDACFSFLNNMVCFNGHIDWHIKEMDRLWRYNLHYFEYIMATSRISVKDSIDIIQHWILENPKGRKDAWDSFPTSLRIVNWIKFLHHHQLDAHDNEMILSSLIQQGQWLEKHIEYHLMGNHLFKNAKALIFLGRAFAGKDAARWFEKGLKMITNQLDEQILEDGGHFERSPMYHAMILEDCIDLINILNQEIYTNGHDTLEDEPGPLVTLLKDKAAKMATYLLTMTHPDGRISLFNDAAFGIEQEPKALVSYYEKVIQQPVKSNSKQLIALPFAGYYVLSPNSLDRMIIDCGDLGPEYQPGHGHCDALSFELSANGHRVVVDSGCMTYLDSGIREYNRGTIGHNTVMIDDKNQSEIWRSHRCGRRARPLHVTCYQLGEEGIYFRGGHDGYRFLKGEPIHFREVDVDRALWRVKDLIKGRGTHSVRSRLHINPLLELIDRTTHVIITHQGQHLVNITPIMRGTGRFSIAQGWYCPEFGLKFECPVLELFDPMAILPYECGWNIQVFKS